MPYRMPGAPHFVVDYAGASIAGRSRDLNQDAWTSLESASLFVVADGGGAGGRAAADLAVQSFRRLFSGSNVPEHVKDLPGGMDRMAVAACEANAAILQTSTMSENTMASAVVALRLEPPWGILVALGDCRLYRYRRGYDNSTYGADATGGLLSRVTLDDDVWLDLVRAGADVVEAQDIAGPHTKAITRALGFAETLEVEVNYLPLEAGDLFLLCSDGLGRQLPHGEIQGIVSDDSLSLEERCERLVQSADERRGRDNVTAVLVELGTMESMT